MTRILVIEDMKDIREGIAEALEDNRFEVATAADGLEGLQLVRETLPDLVICDIVMPELNGYEVLRELRSDSATAAIPFIFLTAKSNQPDVRLGMELGADDYLTKPFREQELLAAIKTRLDKRAVLEAHQMRLVSHKFIRFQEEERRALARKIRESITQPLAGLKLSFHGAERLPARELELRLGDLQALADDILSQVTSATHDLWPVILDDLGLLPAFLQQFEQFTARTNIRVSFTHSDLDRAFSPEVKLAAYRFVQEALSNAGQYAQVSEIQVTAWTEAGILFVNVEDQGVGFDLETTLNMGATGGLIQSRERIAVVDGDMTIHTAPGEGVQITARIPFSEISSDMADAENPLSPSFTESRTESPRHAGDVINIVIAEENQIIREGLKHLLANAADLAVQDEVVHRMQLLTIVRDTLPDVLILGLTLSGATSLDLIPPALTIHPRLRVLIFASRASEVYAYEAMRSGASGYVVNDSSVGDLLRAVRTVARGDAYWGPSLSDDTINLRLTPYQSEDSVLDRFSALTSREREILTLIAEGQTSKQIARLLSISRRTAETHRNNIARKLGLRTQAELIHFAFKHGLVNPHQ